MKAVILAGGLGTRLTLLTQIIPKPLLPLGESSVLETQIVSLRECGFDEIYIATNYRADYVQAFVGDGAKYGVRIEFSRESKRLGTCGPLLLLKDVLTEPFLVMNGDVLTTLPFDKAFRFAVEADASLTAVTEGIVTAIQFGKAVTRGDRLVDVEEKPNLKLEILCGVYVAKPEVLDLIPPDTRYDMDALIKTMLASDRRVARYLTEEFWLDIGRVEDYREAQDAYRAHFTHLQGPH